MVVSLDFELHWGVRDVHAASRACMGGIHGARRAIPRLLDLFAEYEIAATWATVGFLFAECRDELESFHPALRPSYQDRRLDPYAEAVGPDEARDPLHYAPSVIRQVQVTPRQEIGTHTYSHFYCLEAGNTAEAFEQDLASAVAIARAKGVEIKSIVLPRNQWNPAYAQIVRNAGIQCYRGNQTGWMYAPSAKRDETAWKRGARLIDAYVPLAGHGGASWLDRDVASGLYNVGGSCFLRPVGQGSGVANRLRLRRIKASLTQAARTNRIFHLWWHPHNFGSHTGENLQFLRLILEHYRKLHAEYGMLSLSMIGATEYASQSCGDHLEPASADHRA